MKKIEFHNFRVDNYSKFSSDFLNQVIQEFQNNLITLYYEFKQLLFKSKEYENALFKSLEWLTSRVISLSIDNYTISPSKIFNLSNHVNIYIAKEYGVFYLNPLSITSVIKRYTDEYGIQRAYHSIKTHRLVNNTWVEDNSLRSIIDSKTHIWQLETDTSELSIGISFPIMDQPTNLLEIFPLAGTRILEIKVGNKLYEMNTDLPVKISDDFGIIDKVSVKLGGYPQNNQKYYYSLSYLDLYRCNFHNEGTVTYTIGTFSTINNISFNNDYIPDEYKIKFPIRIEILSNDESVTYYDTNLHEYPIIQSINIPDNTTLKARITLTKVNNITPMIKFINIEGV